MNKAGECPPKRVFEELLQGVLSESQIQLLDEHFEQCPDCQRHLDRLTRTQETAAKKQSQDTFSSSEQVVLSSLIDRLCDHPPEEVSSHSQSGPRSAGLDSAKEETSGVPCGGRVGHYRLIEELGSGASGRLFRAIDERLERSVALKILRESQTESDEGRVRLEREARAAARLKHDHIVGIYDVSLADGDAPHIVYELIEGESLSQRLRRANYLSPSQTARIACQIALALDAAHQVGLVHRDVKPSNILLEASTGRAKITDFGLARSDEHQTRLTMEGMIAGTPAYMSPEQVINPHEVDRRSDLYSLGVTMYEMLTGELPFRGVVRMTLMQVLHEDPVPIRHLNDEVPIDMETIVAKTMAKEVARRYASATELADDLQRFLDGESIEARPVGRVEKTWRTVRRNPRIASLSAAVVFLLMGVAIGSALFAWKLASTQQEASQARQKAQRDARTAAEQRNLALETLRQLVFEVHDDLEDGGLDIQETQLSILKTALGGLQQLADSTEGSDMADFSSAVAHNRLGMALYGLGNLTEAVSQLQLAHEATDQLLNAGPENINLQRLKAEVLLNLGMCLDDLGETAEAESHLKTSISIGQKLVESDSQDQEAMQNLADAFREMGELIEEVDLEKAVASYWACITVLQKLVEENPDDSDLKHELLAGWFYLGQLEVGRGNREIGQVYLEACIVTGDDFDSTYPCNHIKNAHVLLGEASAEAEQISEAESHYKKAWQLGNEMLEAWPNDEEVLELNSELELRLAQIQSELGNETISRQWFYTAQETIQRLLKNTGLLPEKRSEFHGTLGSISLIMNQPEAAEQQLQTAFSIVEQALQEDPTNYEMWQQQWLYCTKMILVAPTPLQKRRWMQKASDVLLRTAQNVDTEEHPDFFEWMHAAEQELAQQEQLLAIESQPEPADEKAAPGETEPAPGDAS